MEMESLKFIGMGLVALGMAGAAIGVGLVFSSALQGIARNPGVENKIKPLAFVGAALAEIMGLLSFVLGMLMMG